MHPRMKGLDRTVLTCEIWMSTDLPISLCITTLRCEEKVLVSKCNMMQKIFQLLALTQKTMKCSMDMPHSSQYLQSMQIQPRIGFPNSRTGRLVQSQACILHRSDMTGHRREGMPFPGLEVACQPLTERHLLSLQQRNKACCTKGTTLVFEISKMGWKVFGGQTGCIESERSGRHAISDPWPDWDGMSSCEDLSRVAWPQSIQQHTTRSTFNNPIIVHTLKHRPLRHQLMSEHTPRLLNALT